MIERTTKIGELLEIAPEKAEILLQAGMHCLGCPASQEETLEEACEVHGIDVNEVLEELNKSIKAYKVGTVTGEEGITVKTFEGTEIKY